MAEDGRLNCIAKGIYTLPDTIPDELYILSLFSDNIFFFHETALFCNGLSERTPFEHSYTLPQGKRLSSTFSKGFKSYYCKQELFNLGKITVKTAFGNEVPCYDAERTICDVIKDKNKKFKYMCRLCHARQVKVFLADRSHRLVRIWA